MLLLQRRAPLPLLDRGVDEARRAPLLARGVDEASSAAGWGADVCWRVLTGADSATEWGPAGSPEEPLPVRGAVHAAVNGPRARADVEDGVGSIWQPDRRGVVRKRGDRHVVQRVPKHAVDLKKSGAAFFLTL